MVIFLVHKMFPGISTNQIIFAENMFDSGDNTDCGIIPLCSTLDLVHPNWVLAKLYSVPMGSNSLQSSKYSKIPAIQAALQNGVQNVTTLPFRATRDILPVHPL
jgi:hypothetical protein